jgi:hypothetical protein
VTQEEHWKQEHTVLDAIHTVLERPGNRGGLSAREIADTAGMAIGRVTEVLYKSEAVLKQRPRSKGKWFADWRDVPESFRPKRKVGRPPGSKKVVVTGNADPLAHPERLGKLAVFEGVRNYPARVKCASLAWHTLRSAVDAKDEVVSTEVE